MSRRATPVQGRSFPWQDLDDERRNALLLYGLIGAVVVFALGIIAWGYYQDRIAPNNDTVLTVGDRDFSLAYLERRIEADLRGNRSPQAKSIQELVVKTMQQIEIEELTRQAGAKMGVNPTEDDIDTEIKTGRLNLPADVGRNLFAARYRELVLTVGLPVAEFREIIAAQIVTERLQEQYKAPVPAEGEQVDAQVIVTATETSIREAKAKLDGGQAFNVTALDFSIDGESKEAGGEVGWVSRGELETKVADVLFSQPLGQVSEPFQATGGWYIVLARAKETRAIDAVQKQRIGERSFSTLIETTRSEAGSSSKLNTDQISRIGNRVFGG